MRTKSLYILLARGNHTLAQFFDKSISPTWSETVDLIPNLGETTIVDLSLQGF